MSSESTLARTHPDHPTLTQLDTSPNSATASSPVLSTISSPPPVVTTPSSISPPNSPPAAEPLSFAMKRPGQLSDSPNARSKSVSVADGHETFGVLNRHPAPKPIATEQTLNTSFRVGVSEDRNKRCRRVMEDSHAFIYDYGGVRGQGYFAVFDGHAGKHAAEWCGQNFHEYLLDGVVEHPDESMPDVMNEVYLAVDRRLSHVAYKHKTHSGCTAVTAFLRVEHNVDGGACGFTNPGLSSRGLLEGRGDDELEAMTSHYGSSRRSSMGAGSGGVVGGAATPTAEGLRRKLSGRRIRDFVRGLTGSGREHEEAIEDDATSSDSGRIETIEPKSEHGIRRMLYTANVGDARAVISRGGKAVRLTYDHKGSDAQEAKRITDAGGFVMNNRVNGVLAVTRSLGDASMKEFVVGAPYTTETTLDDDDEFLIIACDGLWDVCEDQEAVDLIRNFQDPQEASKRLLDHALSNYSTDNLSIMVVRFYTGK